MKPATKAKSAGRGKTTAKRPVSAKKPKTAPKKSPPKKKIAVVPPGLAFGEFEALRKQLDLSLDELMARLGLSRATVAQRKAAGRLTNDESGKVVCFARLLGHAVHLFGDLEEARQWLKTPQRGSAWRGAARLRQDGDGGAGSREPAQPARRLQPYLRLRIDPFRRTNLRCRRFFVVAFAPPVPPVRQCRTTACRGRAVACLLVD